MPHHTPEITIVFDKIARRRIITFKGDVGDSHFFEFFSDQIQQPDYDHGADDLVDLIGVTKLGLTSDGLQQIMSIFSQADELGHKTRLAIVAPSDETYGVSRMYQMMRGDDAPEEIRIFRELAHATAWLDSGRTLG